MNKQEYIKARDHNSRIIQHCLRTHTTDFGDIVFWENGVKGRELSMDLLCAKWADIIACAAIGAVPSRNREGCDGYIWYSGEVIPTPIEAKLSGIDQENLARGRRGALYYSSNLSNWNSKAIITSHISGQFDAKMTDLTMDSKRRDTFLVLFDRKENQIIDVLLIEADKTLELLEDRRGNATMTLKLSAFINHGTLFETTWNLETFEVWRQRMYDQCTRTIMEKPYAY